eukprot:scpid99447/ scgid21101/ 
MLVYCKTYATGGRLAMLKEYRNPLNWAGSFKKCVSLPVKCLLPGSNALPTSQLHLTLCSQSSQKQHDCYPSSIPVSSPFQDDMVCFTALLSSARKSEVAGTRELRNPTNRKPAPLLVR